MPRPRHAMLTRRRRPGWEREREGGLAVTRTATGTVLCCTGDLRTGKGSVAVPRTLQRREIPEERRHAVGRTHTHEGSHRPVTWRTLECVSRNGFQHRLTQRLPCAVAGLRLPQRRGAFLPFASSPATLCPRTGRSKMRATARANGYTKASSFRLPWSLILVLSGTVRYCTNQYNPTLQTCPARRLLPARRTLSLVRSWSCPIYRLAEHEV